MQIKQRGYYQKGESESMTGSKSQCKSYSFKGKTKKSMWTVNMRVIRHVMSVDKMSYYQKL